MQTPQKRVDTGVWDVSLYAKKLHKFGITGSYVEDNNRATAHLHLQQMVFGLQQKPELVQLVFGKYMEAVTAEASQGEWTASEWFVPQPKHILQLPDEFVMQFIIKNTDIPSGQLTMIMKGDSKGAHKIYCGMVQLPMTFRLDGTSLHVRGVVNHVSLNRLQVCGERLKNAFAEGALINGDIFWADCGAYNNQFDEQDRLVLVIHKQTRDEAVIDPMEYLVVNGRWDLVCNWSDLEAGWVHGKRPPVKLCDFFCKGARPTGPWNIAQYTSSKQKEWVSYYDAPLEEFKAHRARVAAGGESADVAKRLSVMKKEKKDVTTEKCKVAAKRALDGIRAAKKAKAKPKAKAKANGEVHE